MKSETDELEQTIAHHTMLHQRIARGEQIFLEKMLTGPEIRKLQSELRDKLEAEIFQITKAQFNSPSDSDLDRLRDLRHKLSLLPKFSEIK